MRISFASDHGGFRLKEHLKARVEKLGHTVVDCGTFSGESCDYPDFARPAALEVAQGRCEAGIAICNTGIGISMACNKVPGVRCALCRDVLSAQLTRQHNDANMLALAGGFTAPFEAEHIVEAFLSARFEGGRHQRRVDKISRLDGERAGEG